MWKLKFNLKGIHNKFLAIGNIVSKLRIAMENSPNSRHWVLRATQYKCPFSNVQVLETEKNWRTLIFN